MQPKHREQCLAGGLTQNFQIFAFDGHFRFPHPYLAKQAAIACGSMASQTPASRSRVSPSRSSGRTTRMAGTDVILTIAALAEAAARKTCCAPHQGGKATATSAPG